MKLLYEDALFYMLLIQINFVDEVNKWIDNIAITHDKLEGVYLDLVYYQNDINKIASILHNYIGDNIVDDKLICDRLRTYINKKFINNEISMKEAALSLFHLSRIDDKQYNKYWNDFYILGEYYYCVEERMVDPNRYYSTLTKYLKTGQQINTDKLWINQGLKFKDIILKEKQEMNPIRYKYTYIVAPIFLCIFVIIITTVGILMSINEEKYTPFAIVLFFIMGLIIISLLISVPLVRKKEIDIELQKYNLKIDDIEQLQYVVKSDDGTECVFNKTGVVINNINYKYDDLNFNFYTTKYLMKVHLNVEMILKGEEDITPYWNFKLNKDLLNTIVKYNILLSNKNVLNYIINNKRDSFKQILSYGYVKKFK